MLTHAELSRGFVCPPDEYGPAVFWFLNAGMEREELAQQLGLMHTAGVHLVVLHARAGHTVPYLSEEWLAGIRFCVESCAALGMKCWLYDEDNWPSGYAGGEVLRRYPTGYAKCLAMVPAEQAQGEVVATADGYAFVERPTPWHPAFSNGWYVDLLDPRVTEVFIQTTHERYAAALGDHLGRTVLAVFTDEPGFYNHFYDCAPGTVVWTPDMPLHFRERAGYHLLPGLRGLFVDEPGADQVRRDFYRVVSELISEHFYQPLKRWCHEHGMELAGHINNEELLVDHVRLNADFFTAMDGLDVPGLDIIGPPGNYRRAPDSIVPRLTASAAHTRGKRRVLSETYGAMGWELSPQEMRRLADWLGVRGVTRLVLHAFFQSIEGFRYEESPPSLFFQSPHWPYMPALLQYLTRWSWLLENTLPGAQVAVYYPLDAVRGVTSPQVPPSLPEGIDEEATEAGRLGKAFRLLTDSLFRSQVDYEVVDDVALGRATISDGRLRIHDLEFRCLILPPGEPSDHGRAAVDAAHKAGVQVLSGDTEAVVQRARSWAVAELDPPSRMVTVTRRRAADADLFLVVNEGQDRYEGTLKLPARGQVTQWDWVGQVTPCPAETAGGSSTIRLHLLGGSAACFAVRRP